MAAGELTRVETNGKGMWGWWPAAKADEGSGWGNRKHFSTYKAYNGGFNLLSIGQICDNKCRVTFSEHDSEITKDGKVIGYSQNSKAYIILNKHTRKFEKSLNVTFDESPPPSKTSPLVDDDLDEEEAIREIEKKNLENVVEDET
ncbi:hypothetical protein Tco_0299689 [Tanacetum coccineum]